MYRLIFLEEETLLLVKLRQFAEGTTIDENEEFHFQYEHSPSDKPRIYNDMITIKGTDPLIKVSKC
jgi:uncharacterized Rmd1/YagE family protein